MTLSSPRRIMTSSWHRTSHSLMYTAAWTEFLMTPIRALVCTACHVMYICYIRYVSSIAVYRCVPWWEESASRRRLLANTNNHTAPNARHRSLLCTVLYVPRTIQHNITMYLRLILWLLFYGVCPVVTTKDYQDEKPSTSTDTTTYAKPQSTEGKKSLLLRNV